MYDRARRDSRVVLFLLAEQSGRGEHTRPHHLARVGYFNADLGCAYIRIENRTDVDYRALESLAGIGVELDVDRLPEVHAGHIGFVDVTDDPHRGQVRNGEWFRRR